MTSKRLVPKEKREVSSVKAGETPGAHRRASYRHLSLSGTEGDVLVLFLRAASPLRKHKPTQTGPEPPEPPPQQIFDGWSSELRHKMFLKEC